MDGNASETIGMDRYGRVMDLMEDDLSGGNEFQGYYVRQNRGRSPASSQAAASPRRAPEQVAESPSMVESSILPQSSSPQAVAPQGGSGQTTSSALSAAGSYTGNPYLIAAGLGLQAVSSAKNREMARRTQNINNEIARRDRVMQLMANLGQGIGSLG